MELISTTSDATARTPNLDEAWRAHGPAAIRLATVLVGRDDAHDIAVSAFLRVTSQVRSPEIEHFQSYLLRAVTNEAHNLYRLRERRQRRDLAAVGPDAATDRVVDVDLRRAISALSVRQRTVVFLAYWEDMTEASIAETLELSRGTVHRDLRRARHRLRRAYE
jgi:RNA polymerase sigma factor (sigma-70 family)